MIKTSKSTTISAYDPTGQRVSIRLTGDLKLPDGGIFDVYEAILEARKQGIAQETTSTPTASEPS